MKVAALFSGGKDSTYAIYLAQQRGWAVTRLVSLFPEADDSYMFHVPNIHLTPMLAEAMDINFVNRVTTGEKERELEDLKEALTNLNVDGVLSGAIASDYQSVRIDRICFELGLVCYSQLWRWKQKHVLEDMILAGFKIMIVGVYAEGLGKNWLGKILDADALSELEKIAKKHGINLSGEGGEFETLVVDGPNFVKRLEIVNSEITWNGINGHMNVTDARLAKK
jgi:diphthine-ammonia ligase